MSIVSGGLERALLKYPGLDLERLKIIGWGAGQLFRDTYPLLRDRIELAYTVCPLEENQGREVHGVEVKAPSALLAENPDEVLIVTWTNHYGLVMNQIRQAYPAFRVVKALTYERNAYCYDELLDFQALLQAGLPVTAGRALARPRAGIFIQGLFEEYTPLILAWNKLHFPTVHQCMATWPGQSEELLEKSRPWLDELYLIEPPTNLGHDNRNAVRRSSRAGLELLAARDIEYAVRCRSDCFLTGSIYQAIDRHFSFSRNREKIAVSFIGGSSVIPFHFTGKTMLGTTAEMSRLWSIAEDEREKGCPDFEFSADDFYQKISGISPESTLWIDYARRCGYATGNLRDSFAFAAGKLLPMEPCLSWASIRFIPLFSLERIDAFFHGENWKELLMDRELMDRHAEHLDASGYRIDDIWKNRIG